MLWERETLYGQFTIERWTLRVPNIGRLRIEYTDYRKLNQHKVWKVSCYPLELRHDIIAETPEEAQQQALDYLKAKLVETLESLT